MAPWSSYEPIYHREDGSERIGSPRRLPIGGFIGVIVDQRAGSNCRAELELLRKQSQSDASVPFSLNCRYGEPAESPASSPSERPSRESAMPRRLLAIHSLRIEGSQILLWEQPRCSPPTRTLRGDGGSGPLGPLLEAEADVLDRFSDPELAR
jgi:hypothetical protein